MIIPITTFFFSAIVASIIVIVLAFFISRPKSKFKYYVLAFFICLLLIYIEHFIEFSGLSLKLSFTIYMATAGYYLLAPLFNLIIKSIFGESLVPKTLLLESIPALGSLIYMIPFYILPGPEKYRYTLNYAEVTSMAPRHIVLISLLFLQLGVYAVIWNKRIRHYSQSIKSGASTGDLEFIPWLSKLIGLIILFVCSIAIVAVVRVLWPDQFGMVDQSENIILTLIPYVFIFLIFFLPEKPFPKVNTTVVKESKEKNHFGPEAITRLEQLMNSERLYLNPDLTLSDVAARLELSRHKLSALLSQGLGKSFYDFVNEYRVEEAKALMDSEMIKTFSLSGIARESGFNNYVSFYRVFKRFTRQSPSDYLKKKPSGQP